jgi:hypothetical protein
VIFVQLESVNTSGRVTGTTALIVTDIYVSHVIFTEENGSTIGARVVVHAREATIGIFNRFIGVSKRAADNAVGHKDSSVILAATPRLGKEKTKMQYKSGVES